MTTLSEQAHEKTPATVEFLGTEEGAHHNVGQTERVISLIGGGVLLASALRKPSIHSIVSGVAGLALLKRGITGNCELYRALGINTSGEPARPEEYFNRGVHVQHSITVNRLPWELYDYWRNFENLPRIMNHLESVKVLDSTRSHWTAKAPAGMTVEWDAEIINDEPGSLIAWRSLAGADVDNAGSVRFVPAADGEATDVKVVLDYIPPVG